MNCPHLPPSVQGGLETISRMLESFNDRHADEIPSIAAELFADPEFRVDFMNELGDIVSAFGQLHENFHRVEDALTEKITEIANLRRREITARAMLAEEQQVSESVVDAALRAALEQQNAVYRQARVMLDKRIEGAENRRDELAAQALALSALALFASRQLGASYYEEMGVKLEAVKVEMGVPVPSPEETKH